MGSREDRRAAMKIRALRVSFRDAIGAVHELPRRQQGPAVASIVRRAQGILEELRTELDPKLDPDITAAETEVNKIRELV
jgi:hypothetical protein